MASVIRAAGIPPISTVPDPVMITSTPHPSVSRAAGRPDGFEFDQRRGFFPRCGKLEAWIIRHVSLGRSLLHGLVRLGIALHCLEFDPGLPLATAGNG